MLAAALPEHSATIAATSGADGKAQTFRPSWPEIQAAQKPAKLAVVELAKLPFAERAAAIAADTAGRNRWNGATKSEQDNATLYALADVASAQFSDAVAKFEANISPFMWSGKSVSEDMPVGVQSVTVTFNADGTQQVEVKTGKNPFAEFGKVAGRSTRTSGTATRAAGSGRSSWVFKSSDGTEYAAGTHKGLLSLMSEIPQLAVGAGKLIKANYGTQVRENSVSEEIKKDLNFGTFIETASDGTVIPYYLNAKV